MKISKSLLMALAAGSAATGIAYGQQEYSTGMALEAPLPHNYTPNFGSRANALVYSTGLPTETGGGWRFFGSNYYSMADDVSFTPGLGTGGNFQMNGIAFAWIISPTPVVAAGTARITFTVFDDHAPGVLPPYGNQLSQFAFDVAHAQSDPGGGFLIQFFPNPIAIPALGQYLQPDDNCMVQMDITDLAGVPHTNLNVAGRGGYSGSTIITEAGTTNFNRSIRQAPTPGTWALNGTTAVGGARAIYLKLQGDVTIPTPTCTSVPAITDAGASLPVAAGNNVEWYCVTINGDATDDAGNTFDGQFFDLDTEGSDQDLSIALYDSAGARVGVDADGGSGTNAQLSYGMGRRAAVGDGDQYDGRHGELLAGTYYLAVAPAGATFSNSAFNVTSATPLAGTNQVRFFTNTGGSPLAASVPPIATHLGMIDGSAQVTTGAVQPEANRVAWFSFETCVAAEDPTSYLDLDSIGSHAVSDGEVFIFDSVGNLVATDDDNGPGAFPQLSFGQIAPSRLPFGDGLAFEGQNGTLPAGFYYMGLGLFDTYAKINNPATDGRWHLRCESGSSLTQQITFTPSWTECPAGNCPWSQGGCIADYNGSGGTPDDADVAAFFDAWNAGDECSDANGSGGTPDDADVAMFFDLWNQGGC
ncbi:MAG: hypothetical protein IPM33_12080 [Phycisphaerales bacterium]|nr:hypothetical protein [Phycisphaerales bacterium]